MEPAGRRSTLPGGGGKDSQEGGGGGGSSGGGDREPAQQHQQPSSNVPDRPDRSRSHQQTVPNADAVSGVHQEDEEGTVKLTDGFSRPGKLRRAFVTVSTD